MAASAGTGVALVTLASAQILDVTGPLEVFSSATRFVPSVCYETELVSARGGPVRASCDLEFTTLPIAEVRDPIYVRDGNIWTSAGVTAGIDLALALVADDHGREAAAVVARQLVVYLRRSGGQRQFSALLAAQAADSEPMQDLLAWLPDHLMTDLSVPALARQINLSERQFSRLFKSEVASTPADYVDRVRVEAACRLLESTHGSIEQVARTCGFGTPETMNRAFRRRLNTTPGDHRHHFSTST